MSDGYYGTKSRKCIIKRFCFIIMLGAMLRTIWQGVKDLEQSDKEINDKLTKIEVTVAGNYIRRAEFNDMVQRLFTKLDAIDQKLDAKVDK